MRCLHPLADVAQLVEQRFRKPQVTGSNPVVGSPNFEFRIAECGLLVFGWTLKVERWAFGVSQ